MGGCPRNYIPERMWFPWGHRHPSQSWGGAVTTDPNGTPGHRIHCTRNQNPASFSPWKESLHAACSWRGFEEKRQKWSGDGLPPLKCSLALSQAAGGSVLPVDRRFPLHLEVMKQIERHLKIPLPSWQGDGRWVRKSLVCCEWKFFIGKADRCSIYMRKPSYCYPNLSESLTWHLS